MAKKGRRLHQFGAGTDVGNVRENNEDSYVCDSTKGLWVVADGMGGLGFGEVASAITVHTIATMIQRGHGVNQAIEVAHRKIKEYAETDGLGTNMGTTLVLLLSQGSLYNIFWVGDSRAYMFDGNLKRITIDHSLVQSLIDQGELTPEQAEFDPRKNAVTRALGVQELDTVRADSVSERWRMNQKILLCSDGLTDCVRDPDIEAIMQAGGSDQEIVDALVERALENGGKDNVTVLLVSAPDMIGRGDSDTEIPSGYADTDATRAPNDDTQSDYNDDDATIIPDQNSADRNTDKNVNLISAPVIAFASTDKAATEQISTPNKDTIDSDVVTDKPLLKRWFMAAAAIILVVFSTVFFPGETITQPAQAKLIETGPMPLPPEGRNPIPATSELTTSGLLQLGLFSTLESAETIQRQVLPFGLLARVEKRATDKGLKYAVLMGPYDDEAEMTKHAGQLQQHSVTYYIRRTDS